MTRNIYEFYNDFEPLFNKYSFGISNPDKELEYELILENKGHKFMNNKLWACLHCYDINKFTEIYGEYIENITKYFSVIVTYSIGETIPDINCNIIKIPNKGRDIGALLICLDFLYKNKIEFSNILFLHSKTDKEKRLCYFKPLIENEMVIEKNIELLNEYDGIFNNMIENNLIEHYYSNRYYHKEILKYFKVHHNELKFTEGNCLILSRKVIDFMFKLNIKFFYNILNSRTSFDISWVKNKYNKHIYNNEQLFDDFINNKEYMNLNGDGIAVGNNFSDIKNSLPDGMIEHVFERIYVNIIEHLNLKYIVV